MGRTVRRSRAAYWPATGTLDEQIWVPRSCAIRRRKRGRACGSGLDPSRLEANGRICGRGAHAEVGVSWLYCQGRYGMRSVIRLALILVSAFALTACGTTASAPPTAAPAAPAAAA